MKLIILILAIIFMLVINKLLNLITLYILIYFQYKL